MPDRAIARFSAAHPHLTIERLDWPGPIAYLPKQLTVVVSTRLTPAQTSAALIAVEGYLSLALE